MPTKRKPTAAKKGSKPIRVWAISREDGELLRPFIVGATPGFARWKLGEQRGQRWEALYKCGYRCVRVEIKEIGRAK